MKSLLCFSVLASSLFGQSYQQIFDHVTTTQASVPVRGGSTSQFHQITVFVFDTSHLSCGGDLTGGWSGNIRLEGSFDNATWVPFGTPVVFADVGTGVSTVTTGAFSYIRVNYDSSAVGDECSVSAYYSGTASGQSNSTAPITAGNDSVQTIQYSQTFTSGLYATCQGNTWPQIYYFSVSNFAATPVTITLQSQDEGMTTKVLINAPLAGSQTLQWSNGGTRPVAFVNSALNPPTLGITGLNLLSTTSTKLTGSISYRCE